MTGVNYYGFFKDISGIAEAARLNVTALKKAGVAVSMHNYYVENRKIKKDEKQNEVNLHQTDFDINIFHINLNSLTDFFEANSNTILKNKYNIAYWAWEFNEIPEEILPYLTIFDEIWVPSNFCVEAFASVSPIPVLRFLHPINPNYITLYSKEELGIPTNSFNFLAIFDSISTTERKNPFAAINAFQKAFESTNENVKLIVKTFNLERNKNLMKELTETISNSKNVILINENYDKSKMEALLQHCDSLISLHRSEGFGLTMAEAMSYGKPVIGTGYSGNLDYMNINNSMLVKYEYTRLSEDSGILKKGFVMANPIIEDAIKHLQFVVENKKAAEQIGNTAKQEINSILSLEKIGIKMKNRINLIQANFIKSDVTNESDFHKDIIIQNTVLKEKIKYLENTLYAKLRRKINAFFKKNK